MREGVWRIDVEVRRTVAHILGNSEATHRLHYDGRNDTGKRKAIAALELGVTNDASARSA